MKPSVCRAMFCSLRRPLEQASVTGSSSARKLPPARSATVSRAGRRTRPVTSTVQVAQSARGTVLWLRT